MLAGAAKKGGTAVKAACQAGGQFGVATAGGKTAATVCCKYQLWVAQEREISRF